MRRWLGLRRAASGPAARRHATGPARATVRDELTLGSKSYVAVHKPYGVLSAFTTRVAGQRTLGDLSLELPTDVYAVGRLDADSEGLLLLSNDGAFIDAVLTRQTRKAYLVQVDGVLGPGAVATLTQAGVAPFRPALAVEALEAPIFDNFEASDEPPSAVGEKLPPCSHIRRRRRLPTQWLRVEIDEGQNRQVRRMLAAVGLPVLRLFRERIGDLSIFDLRLASGEASHLTGPERVLGAAQGHRRRGR
ncbi:pseudouridine synthase [Pelagophyceae sp. CCMP2097]|nr:pseudouridine synthase [Pelagophyceae sp. CCMP2097]